MKDFIEKFNETKYTEPTELCILMDTYGSDKGPENLGAGNYTKLYNYIFSDIKETTKNFLEFGLGSNYTDTPSNMGPEGRPGASLRGFRDYFKNANIFGADLDKRVLFSEERIQTFFVDQLSLESLNELLDKFEFEFDVIIDDGIHDLSYRDRRNNISGNIQTLEVFLKKVKKGGYYIIEDVAPWQWMNDKTCVVDPAVSDLVRDIESGKYGQVSYVDVINTPRTQSRSHLQDTQVILIKK
jgi:hypothetical protein